MVHDFVEDMQRRRQSRQNTSQFAIAAFAASHDKRWNATDFLPWNTEATSEVQVDTLEILRRLVDNGVLNPRAEAAARARLRS